MLERRGFGLLANHFEESQLLRKLPHYLPDDWKGAFALLVMVFVLSSFLDNIAAALIGGAMAHTVFNKRVHFGYIVGFLVLLLMHGWRPTSEGII